MSNNVLTIRLNDEELRRLRQRFPDVDLEAAVERLLDECLGLTQEEAERERGWAALDALIGMVHGDGTAGSDEHDRWGLGTDE